MINILLFSLITSILIIQMDAICVCKNDDKLARCSDVQFNEIYRIPCRNTVVTLTLTETDDFCYGHGFIDMRFFPMLKRFYIDDANYCACLCSANISTVNIHDGRTCLCDAKTGGALIVQKTMDLSEDSVVGANAVYSHDNKDVSENVLLRVASTEIIHNDDCSWLDEWMTWSKCVPMSQNVCGQGRRVRVRGPRPRILPLHDSTCPRTERELCQVSCDRVANRNCSFQVSILERCNASCSSFGVGWIKKTIDIAAFETGSGIPCPPQRTYYERCYDQRFNDKEYCKRVDTAAAATSSTIGYELWTVPAIFVNPNRQSDNKNPTFVCNYSKWVPVTKCNATCSDLNGTIAYSRQTLNDTLNCLDLTRHLPCSKVHLNCECMYTEWSAWTMCSSSCGNGLQDRFSYATTFGKNYPNCQKHKIETVSCYSLPCQRIVPYDQAPVPSVSIEDVSSIRSNVTAEALTNGSSTRTAYFSQQVHVFVFVYGAEPLLLFLLLCGFIVSVHHYRTKRKRSKPSGTTTTSSRSNSSRPTSSITSEEMSLITCVTNASETMIDNSEFEKLFFTPEQPENSSEWNQCQPTFTTFIGNAQRGNRNRAMFKANDAKGKRVVNFHKTRKSPKFLSV